MGAIDPQIYTMKNGESLLVRGARTEDAYQLVQMMNAIVREDIYTLAGLGEWVMTAERVRERIAEYEEGRCSRDMKLASGEYIDSVLLYRFVK